MVVSDDQNDDDATEPTTPLTGAIVGSEVDPAGDSVLDDIDIDDDGETGDDETGVDGEESSGDGRPRWSPPERSDDHLTYDCSDWAGESRALLDSMLSSADIRHTWLGTVLEVPVDEEDRVDAVIDEVMAAAEASLEAGRDKVVYEVATWSSALQQSLAQSLVVAQIAYEWDERGDLVVYADDEERVEEIFDALPDPDDPDLVGDDGIEVQDQLSRLFVAAGHLAKRPTDSDSVVAAADVADRIEQISVPFGFEPAVWRNLVAQSTELRDALVEEDPAAQLDDDELMEKAATLRTFLRQYV
jgi:hypothetical protein